MFENNCQEKENERFPYWKNDLSSTTFSYTRYSKGPEGSTGFVVKNSTTLPSLAYEYSNSLRDENVEPIYT